VQPDLKVVQYVAGRLMERDMVMMLIYQTLKSVWIGVQNRQSASTVV